MRPERHLQEFPTKKGDDTSEENEYPSISKALYSDAIKISLIEALCNKARSLYEEIRNTQNSRSQTQQ